jgi:hypothetical protein
MYHLLIYCHVKGFSFNRSKTNTISTRKSALDPRSQDFFGRRWGIEYLYLSICDGRRSIWRLRPIKHQRNNNLLVRAQNRDLPDVGRVRSPLKPRVPLQTTVQSGGVRVLDEPSMVGLIVWVELPSWRPWFGRSIMMVKASVVKIRVQESGFQLEGIPSKSGWPTQ